MSSRPTGAATVPRRRAASSAATVTTPPAGSTTASTPLLPPITYTVERAAADRVRVTGMGAALAAHAAHAESATCEFVAERMDGADTGNDGDKCLCEMPCSVEPDGTMECALPPACGVGGCSDGDRGGDGAARKTSECTADTVGGGGGGACASGGIGSHSGGGGGRGNHGGPHGLSVRLGSVFSTPRLTLGLAGPQCGSCGGYGFGCHCGALALLAGRSAPPPAVGVVPDTDITSAGTTAPGTPTKDASFGAGSCGVDNDDGLAADGLCADNAVPPAQRRQRLAIAVVGVQRRALSLLQRTRGGCHRFSLWDQCVAEAVGTALIVIFGVGVVCTATLTGSVSGLWQVATVWGFGVALAILCTASVSGAHLNPAVSLAFALFRPDDFPWRKLLPYWTAQYTGGVVGGAINLAIFGPLFSSFEASRGMVRGDAASVLTASAFGEYYPNPDFAKSIAAADVSTARALAIEAWGTGVLMFVILAIIDSRQKLMGGKEMIPFYIGFTVAVLISLYAPLTQAGWNPARDFGPRIVAALAGWGSVAIPGPRNGFWVYIVGPKIGAPLGALVYDMLIAPGLDQ